MPYLELEDFATLSGSLLGLDHGRKTIGIALSDSAMTMALPLKTLIKTKQIHDFDMLINIIQSRSIVGIVLGYPLHENGDAGARAQSVRAFARNFLAVYDIPLLLWDERYSTQIMEAEMIEKLDMSRAKRKQKIDALAAQYILQTALDAIHTQKKPPAY